MCDIRKVLLMGEKKKREKKKREVTLKLLLPAGVGVGCRQ